MARGQTFWSNKYANMLHIIWIRLQLNFCLGCWMVLYTCCTKWIIRDIRTELISEHLDNVPMQFNTGTNHSIATVTVSTTQSYTTGTQHYLNRQSVVGAEHFGLRFRKHLLKPLLHHLREPTGPRIIACSHKLQHWKIKTNVLKNCTVVR